MCLHDNRAWHPADTARMTLLVVVLARWLSALQHLHVGMLEDSTCQISRSHSKSHNRHQHAVQQSFACLTSLLLPLPSATAAVAGTGHASPSTLDSATSTAHSQ